MTTESALDRIPPHDDAAEEAALGAMLLDPRAAEIAAEALQPEDFYLAGRGLLFKTMRDLLERVEELDEVVVRSELERRGLTGRIGGAQRIGQIMEACPSAANIERYCRLVSEKAEARDVILGGARLLRMGHGDEPPEESGAPRSLRERAEEIVYRIADRRRDAQSFELHDLLAAALKEAAAARAGETPAPCVESGYLDLDKLLSGGFWPGEFILVAGRPSMGKTTFAVNVARQAAAAGTAAAIFSLEMTKEQVVKNILAAEAGLLAEKMRTQNWSDAEFERLTETAKEMSAWPLYIEDVSGLTTAVLRSRLRRLKHRAGLRLVIVDYLQLMRPSGRKDSREQEVAEISRDLKSIARELALPVVVLAQLNRAPEGRADKRPLLSDLRESGSLEQDADLVLFLYRDEYYNPGSGEGEAEVIVAKNRNGPTGFAHLTFLKEILRFENFSPLKERQ